MSSVLRSRSASMLWLTRPPPQSEASARQQLLEGRPPVPKRSDTDDFLDEVTRGVDALRLQAEAMGSQLEYQAHQIEQITDKTDRANDKLKKHQKAMGRLL